MLLRRRSSHSKCSLSAGVRGCKEAGGVGWRKVGCLPEAPEGFSHPARLTSETLSSKWFSSSEPDEAEKGPAGTPSAMQSGRH